MLTNSANNKITEWFGKSLRQKVFFFEDPPSGISWKEMIISPREPRPTQTWWDGRPAQILTHRNGHKITSSAFQMAHKPTECATSSIYLVCQMSQVLLFTEHLAIRRFLQSGSSTCWLFEPRNFCPRPEETLNIIASTVLVLNQNENDKMLNIWYLQAIDQSFIHKIKF